MATNYPSSIDTTSDLPNDQVDATLLDRLGVDHAQEHANLSDAVRAIEAELGAAPSGSYATVKARLDTFPPLSTLTMGGNPIQWSVGAVPGTPPADEMYLYVKLVGGVARLFIKDDTGTEFQLPTDVLSNGTLHTGSNYTLALTDANTAVEMSLGSAQTVTVPTNASVAFPLGTVIEVYRHGMGSVTVIPVSGTVVIRSPGGLSALTSQYSTASLRKRATNEWVLSGDLA